MTILQANIIGRRTDGQPVAVRCTNQGRVEVEVWGGAGGVVTVVQPTHDLLNANVTLQVADVDVSATNPVPVEADGGTFVSQLTVTLPAYVAGDCVGGLMTVLNVPRSSGGHVILNSLSLWDRDSQEEPFNLYLFRSNPTASTFTDANPVVLHANDRARLVAGTPIRIFAGDYIAAQSGGSGAARQNVGISLSLDATTLWYVLECVETPDYVNTDALTMIYDFLRD